jgi:tol-pal system protein YbgF
MRSFMHSMSTGLAVRASLRGVSARAVFAAGVLVSAMPLTAQAGLFDDDEARKAILDLRQRVDLVRQDHDKRLQSHDRDLLRLTDENAVLRKGLLDLQNQIETQAAETAKLRGANEQLAREVAEIQRRARDAVNQVDERLRRFEPVKVQVDGRDFMADPAEKRDFDSALTLFRQGDFQAAQVALQDVMRRYPQTGYRASALFWSGNAQYALKEYREAIQHFRNLLAQTPDHLRAPEAMLSMANCQIELKDTKAARKTLEDLIKAHPNSEAAQAAKERLAKLR